MENAIQDDGLLVDPKQRSRGRLQSLPLSLVEALKAAERCTCISYRRRCLHIAPEQRATLDEWYMRHWGKWLPVNETLEEKVLWTCDDCKVGFKSKDMLEVHKHNVHVARCPECGQWFASESGMGAHRSRTHGVRGKHHRNYQRYRGPQAGTPLVEPELKTVAPDIDIRDLKVRYLAVLIEDTEKNGLNGHQPTIDKLLEELAQV